MLPKSHILAGLFAQNAGRFSEGFMYFACAHAQEMLHLQAHSVLSSFSSGNVLFDGINISNETGNDKNCKVTIRLRLTVTQRKARI